MPYYKDQIHLENYFQEAGIFEGCLFDDEHSPGAPAPKAGIYRCTRCGHEIAIAEGHILPPDGTEPHTKHSKTLAAALREKNLDPMKWRLVAQAIHVHDKP